MLKDFSGYSKAKVHPGQLAIKATLLSCLDLECDQPDEVAKSQCLNKRSGCQAIKDDLVRLAKAREFCTSRLDETKLLTANARNYVTCLEKLEEDYNSTFQQAAHILN